MNPDPSHRLVLPDRLVAQLAQFRRSLWRTETLLALAATGAGVLISYLALFLLDRAWDTPSAIRILLVTGAAAGAAVMAAFWGRRWLWRTRGRRDLAQMVQRRHRGLGDRLQGIIELTEATTRGQSEALSRAAIRQVAEEATRVDFDEAVPRARVRLTVRCTAGLVIATVALLFAFRDASWTTWRRWLNPGGNVARYTFAQLAETPAELIVAHGEPFSVTCRLAPDSYWRPSQARATMGRQPPVHASRDGDRYEFSIPGQIQPGILALRVGDKTRTIRIKPVYRPVLVDLLAEITFPEYLQRPVFEASLRGGQIEYVRGSSIQISGTANRTLTSAQVHAPNPESLEVEGSRFASKPFEPGEREELELSWQDRYGLGPTHPQKVIFVGKSDAAPYVECRHARRVTAVLEEDVVNFDFYAIDDFGLKDLTVSWSVTAHIDDTQIGMGDSETLAPGGPQSAELDGTYTFSPIATRVTAGATVVLQARATDYFPNRTPATSAEYSIQVLNWEQHAELIQKAMDAIQNDLEQLIRDVDNVHEQTGELREAPADELGGEKATSALAEQKESETREARNLEELADAVKDTIDKAMRNKKIPEQTLMDLADAAMKMQQIAQQPMTDAAQSLGKAQNSPQNRSEPMDKAMAKQDEAMKKLRELQEQFNQNVEQMLAQTFVNRLRASALSERDISAAMQRHLQDTIGLPPEDLRSEHRTLRTQQAESQDGTRQKVRYIQDDLAGFFNRTRQSIYRDIHSNMIARATEDGLREISTLILDNKSFQSIDKAETWAAQLDAWAEELAQHQQAASSAAQASEGQIPASQKDLEVLLGLERARQQEEVIREQTRKVDETRQADARYTSNARKIARRQGDLAKDMLRLERLASNDRLGQLVEKIGGEMLNTKTMLRKPKTDSETVAVQTEIIELLGAAMASAAQSAAAAGGQSMMKMLGITAAGGGSDQGGDGDVSGALASEGTRGRERDSRDIERSGGQVNANVPREFKDAVEGYLNAVDNLP